MTCSIVEGVVPWGELGSFKNPGHSRWLSLSHWFYTWMSFQSASVPNILESAVAAGMIFSPIASLLFLNTNPAKCQILYMLYLLSQLRLHLNHWTLPAGLQELQPASQSQASGGLHDLFMPSKPGQPGRLLQ